MVRTSAVVGAGLSLLPPPMKSIAVRLVVRSGLTMVSQCFHTGRSTSAAVRQVCDVSSSTNAW